MAEVQQRRLEPLPYHRAVASFLRQAEPELWRWMGTDGRIQQESESVRGELLRSTYRLDEAGHPVVAAAAQRAAGALGLSVPVHVFQAEGDLAPNASLLFLPEEAIVLLSGPIAEVLDPEELVALFGHELAHHHLWSVDGGDHLVAARLLDAMAGEGRGEAVGESLRRSLLTTELFADRGALVASGDLGVTVRTLVKVATGLRSVSAEAFLAQADDVLAAGAAPSEGLTHPETFLRAAALRDWAEGEDVPSAALALVEGPLDIDRLDLLDQRALADLTRTVVERVLRPAWMRSDSTVAHARAFFPGFTPAPEGGTAGATAEPGAADPIDRVLAPATKRYLAYVLLDFASADPDLEREPLAHALVVADELGVRGELERAVDQDLALPPREWDVLRERAGTAPAPEADPA